MHNKVGRGDGEREENVMLATPDFRVIDGEEKAYGFSDIHNFCPCLIMLRGGRCMTQSQRNCGVQKDAEGGARAKGRKLRHTASLSWVDSGRKSDLPRQGISEAGEAVWQLGDCEEGCSC